VRLGRPLQRLMLTADERSTLENWARRRTTAQALALRARIVLQAANGDANTRIARREGVPNATVGKWRGRFLRTRLDRLLDEPRPGVPRKITDAEVEALISRTLESTPRCHALEHANDGESLRLQPIEYFRGSGERLGCSRIASRPSNCRRIRCSSKRSATSSASIWKPVYYVLEDAFTLLLINMLELKRVRVGRLTCGTATGWRSCSSVAC
jgi:transposase